MNIIPDKLTIKGTARSFNSETREYLHTNLNNIANNIARKYNATSNFNFLYAYDPLINDENLSSFVRDCANEVIKDSFIELENKELIGDDFAYFRKINKICYIWLGVRGENQEFYDLHNPSFILDEENLYYAVLLNLQIAKNYK
jgi:amidohydrolase